MRQNLRETNGPWMEQEGQGPLSLPLAAESFRRITDFCGWGNANLVGLALEQMGRAEGKQQHAGPCAPSAQVTGRAAKPRLDWPLSDVRGAEAERVYSRPAWPCPPPSAPLHHHSRLLLHWPTMRCGDS